MSKRVQQSPYDVWKELVDANTSLVLRVLFIVREYLMARKIDMPIVFDYNNYTYLRKCPCCDLKSFDYYDGVRECLLRDCGALVVPDKEKDRAIVIANESTANKHGLTLHAPTMKCTLDCKGCMAAMRNYLAPVGLPLNCKDKLYLSKLDVLRFICPYRLRSCEYWMIEYDPDDVKINLNLYIKRFLDANLNEEDFTKYARRHFKVHHYPHEAVQCLVCGLFGSAITSLSVVQGITICDNTVKRDRVRPIPCWKYVFLKEPNWKAIAADEMRRHRWRKQIVNLYGGTVTYDKFFFFNKSTMTWQLDERACAGLPPVDDES
jgi:hypothetical protein